MVPISVPRPVPSSLSTHPGELEPDQQEQHRLGEELDRLPEGERAHPGGGRDLPRRATAHDQARHHRGEDARHVQAVGGEEGPVAR